MTFRINGMITQHTHSIKVNTAWWYKVPSEEVKRRRLGWTASGKTSRPLGRSGSKANDSSGSHSELLSRMDGIARLLRRTWACSTGGSRGERKHSIAPGASARLVDFYSNYLLDFVLVCLFALVCTRFLPALYQRSVRYGAFLRRFSLLCLYTSLFDLI